jgi:ribonuclease-3
LKFKLPSIFKTQSDYDALEKRLGYHFDNPELLATALTHRSYRYESDEHDSRDNQRMEFLGDAVLGMLTASALYHRFPDKEEGDLTNIRSRITSGKALGKKAEELGLGEYLHVGRGEERSGGRERRSTLADALEATLAAAFLDGGFSAASKVFDAIFSAHLEADFGDRWEGNPKGQLQEYVQQVYKESPQYTVIDESGPSHKRHYTVEVSFNGKSWGQGSGSSKRKAEMVAAKAALSLCKETTQNE